MSADRRISGFQQSYICVVCSDEVPCWAQGPHESGCFEPARPDSPEDYPAQSELPDNFQVSLNMDGVTVRATLDEHALPLASE